VNEQETRRAVQAGIVDGFGSICKGVAIVACITALFVCLSWPLILLFLFVVVPALFVLAGLYEAITRPRRERRETAAAKVRARKYWHTRGWSDADIDAWDSNPQSDWWWIGKSY
jgi:hypothetical protein